MITEKFYIQRLKEMVVTHGEDLCGLCGHCPLQEDFEINGEFIDEAKPNMVSCILCKKLNGVLESGGMADCPCSYYNRTKQVPLEEARKIINKWEKENGEV